jgi:hypothetical protein
MKLKIFILFIGFSPFVCAQQAVDNICMQVLGSTGLYASANGQNYSATMGESLTATLSSSNNAFTITQGFHQPECAKTSVGTQDLVNDWQLVVFPNPTSSHLYIHYLHPQGITLQTRVWSITGALVSDWNSVDAGSTLDCNALNAGIYLLDIKDPSSGQRTTIRFIKSTN